MPPENERSQGLLQQAWADVKEGWNNLHIGQGHFTAWLREGFKEVTHLLLPAFPAGQSIIEEPGLFGNPTQGEVARGRQDQDQARQQVAALNEEPLQTRSQTPSPGELAEARVEVEKGQEIAPGGPAPPVRPDTPSPGELAESNPTPQQQQNPGEQQSQSHGITM